MASDARFRPDWTSAPSDTILDALAERGLGIVELAAELGQTMDTVQDLLDGRSTITLGTARSLSAFLGGSVQFWITRDLQYRDDVQNLTKANRDWLAQLPVGDMIKYGRAGVNCVRTLTSRATARTRSGPVRCEQDVAETAAFWIERHDDDSFATAEGGLAALGTCETVAARSGIVELVLHGPCAVGGEKQVLLGLLSHCGWCQDEQGQGDCDRGLELAQGVLPFKGAARYAESSTPCGPAARFDAIRGATWALRRRYGEDPNGRVRQRGVPHVKDVFPGAPDPGVYLSAVPGRGRSGRPCRGRSSQPKDRRPQLVRVERSLLGRLGKMIAWARSSSSG